ncbi:MAG: succinylglutamate desuccinylase/aspartoacylase family protein [Burkholderiales bacterium]|nr:succinylglutamate desuccinylase/aspartoacylase family protein [Burkholderiales bacterium]
MSKSTTYNGDIINGTPVITSLNIQDLELNKSYRFMFEGSSMNIGQHWYVPVVVLRGSNEGKSILINTGIHGDEINGVRVIQKLISEIDTSKLTGTIIAVLQASPNSLAQISKNWSLATDGGDFENMNRAFPGKESGNSAENHAYRLWNKLWLGNVDYMIDLHSQSTDTEYPLFVFVDYRNKIAREMAMLVPADQIKNDAGEKGTVETTFIEHGIPAITLELGAARVFQNDYIERGLIGVKNILNYFNMYEYTPQNTSFTQETIYGSNMTTIRAKSSGYIEILVQLNEFVKVDQTIAKQYNAFGDVIAEYTASESGVVLSISTGAMREIGSMLVRILHN